MLALASAESAWMASTFFLVGLLFGLAISAWAASFFFRIGGGDDE